jgi:hypothetical protein
MGNANSLFFFQLGERKGFYTVLKLKQGKIGEDPGNKMKFPFVHLCFNHLSGRENKDVFEMLSVKRGKLLKKAMLIKCNSPMYILASVT